MSRIVVLSFAIALVLGCSGAWAQAYPTKTVRIITLDAGGSVDLSARVLAQGLGAAMGQSFIVENRPGGGGVLAIEAVKTAPPDGYMLSYQGSNMWVQPLMQTVPYEYTKDFAPVLLAVASPNALVVHPSLPVNNVKELIALAKSKPGSLSYGASSPGSGPHIAGALFQSMTGIDVVSIPYKGGAQTVADLVGGRLQFAFTTPGTVLAFLKSGKVRPLGTSSLKPSALLPDLPPVADTVPGFTSSTIQGMHVPVKTSRAIINQLYQESAKFLNRPDIRQKLLDAGTEVVAGSPEEFDALIKSEVAKLGPVIKAAGIRTE